MDADAAQSAAASHATDSVETVYGPVQRQALIAAQSSFELRDLLHCVDELRPALEYLGSERGLVDRFTRLYCMTSTIFCGSSAMVPPEDGGLRGELDELRSDLRDAIELFQNCERLLGPLKDLVLHADAPIADK